jgi:DNA (cytosine-5)-methyltransferase 1
VKYLSVCSGIEAASVAWHGLDMHPLAFSEIEPFPCAVLKFRFPKVPNVGDMTKFDQWLPLGVDLADADMLVGGTPCQAFSWAGLRKSLQDARGNLSLTYIKLLNYIDEKRNDVGRPPAVCLWENVPGVLNTPDNAFGCFLGGLAGSGGPLEPPDTGGGWQDAGYVAGPKRTIAWRCLDAQYIGLAQRRHRVFVVASARKGFDPAQVLFEWDGVRRDTAPSREAREVAPTIPARSTAGGGLGTDFDCDGGLQVAGTMKACKDSGGWSNSADHAAAGYMVPVGTICVATGQAGAEIGADMAPTLNCNHEAPYVAHSLRGEGFDASEDGTGRGTPIIPVTGGASPMAFDWQSGGDARGLDPKPTAQLQRGQVPAIAFERRFVRTTGGQPSEELNPTLRADANTGDGAPCVVDTYLAVRRLTPIECERLQGFPDHWTQIPYRGKPSTNCPDGPRYKAIGNSMAVPVMAWIGRRIQDELSKPLTHG